MLNEHDIESKLAGVPEGTEIFVSYQAGRKPTERAVREAKKAEDLGISRRWLEGKLVKVWRTKKNELAVRLFSYTRYNEAIPAWEGHYRTINPNLGQVMVLEVL